MSVRVDPEAAPAPIAAWLAETAPRIDAALDAALPLPADDPGRLVEAMRYAVLGPGKRLRPALALAACAAVGGDEAAAWPAAIAVELLHAYTLVHDDLPALDDDDVRRGRPTVHVVFGEAIAILAGDGLLTAAFAALSGLGARAADAVAVLGRRAGAGELLGGQALDLAAGGAGITELVALERLHAGKTGALFAAALELGGLAGGADARARADLAGLGLAIGIAFQHADDRDDGEHAGLAAAASARAQVWTEVAVGHARALGPPGAHLEAVARWIGERSGR